MGFQPHDDVPQHTLLLDLKFIISSHIIINKDNHKIFPNGVVIYLYISGLLGRKCHSWGSTSFANASGSVI